MPRQDAIKLEGIVVEAMNERLYRVQLSNGHKLLGHVKRVPCSVLREEGTRNTQYATPLPVGRRVTVEMSLFDFSKGRILLNG